MPFPWAPVIAAAGGIIGTGLQSRQQNRNVRRTIDANKALADLRYERDMEMAEYSFDKNLEMWKIQNQYNSPEAQMQRFEDAGLNKHMIYGQGTPGNATGSPSFTGPSYQPPTVDYSGQQSTMGNTLSDFIGASKDVMELRQMDKDLERKTFDARLADWNQRIRSMDIPGANLDFLIDKAKTESLSNMPKEELTRIIKQELTAELNQAQVTRLGQQLNNFFQQEVNDLAQQGMTLGDKMYLRIGAMILNALGYNTEKIMQEMQRPVSDEDANRILSY